MKKDVRKNHVRFASKIQCNLSWPGGIAGKMPALRQHCGRVCQYIPFHQKKFIRKLKTYSIKTHLYFHTPLQCYLTLGILPALRLASTNYKGFASKTKMANIVQVYSIHDFTRLSMENLNIFNILHFYTLAVKESGCSAAYEKYQV